MPLLPGYIGSSVAERRELESRRSYARRLGSSQAERFDIRLSAFELQQRLDAWISAYEDAPHMGLRGRSPNEAWREAVASGWTAHRIPLRELDILLADRGSRMVGKRGIRDEGVDFWCDALVEFVGNRVRISALADMGERICFSADGEFIGVARNPERAGIDRRAMAISARAAWRAHQRKARASDRALKQKFQPARMLAALTEIRGNASPLTAVELADVPLLQAAAEAVAAPDRSRARVSAAPVYDDSEDAAQAVARYQKLLAIPQAVWSDEDCIFMRLASELPEVRDLNRRRA